MRRGREPDVRVREFFLEGTTAPREKPSPPDAPDTRTKAHLTRLLDFAREDTRGGD
jgi:hypothetical protein